MPRSEEQLRVAIRQRTIENSNWKCSDPQNPTANSYPTTRRQVDYDLKPSKPSLPRDDWSMHCFHFFMKYPPTFDAPTLPEPCLRLASRVLYFLDCFDGLIHCSSAAVPPIFLFFCRSHLAVLSTVSMLSSFVNGQPRALSGICRVDSYAFSNCRAMVRRSRIVKSGASCVLPLRPT